VARKSKPSKAGKAKRQRDADDDNESRRSKKGRNAVEQEERSSKRSRKAAARDRKRRDRREERDDADRDQKRGQAPDERVAAPKQSPHDDRGARQPNQPSQAAPTAAEIEKLRASLALLAQQLVELQKSVQDAAGPASAARPVPSKPTQDKAAAPSGDPADQSARAATGTTITSDHPQATNTQAGKGIEPGDVFDLTAVGVDATGRMSVTDMLLAKPTRNLPGHVDNAKSVAKTGETPFKPSSKTSQILDYSKNLGDKIGKVELAYEIRNDVVQAVNAHDGNGFKTGETVATLVSETAVNMAISGGVAEGAYFVATTLAFGGLALAGVTVTAPVAAVVVVGGGVAAVVAPIAAEEYIDKFSKGVVSFLKDPF